MTCSALSVVRPPLFGDPPTSGCLEAWGEESSYAGTRVVSAHFTLAENAELTELHWWGTYREWLDSVPPTPAPQQFHIAIWSHQDALTGNPPTSFARPATILREWYVDRTATDETYVACTLDTTLEHPFGSAFRYAYSFPEADRFTAAAGVSYWISIAAVYGDASCPCDADVAAPFGVYDSADVSYVDSHIGCAVGTGDPSCDAADVNCDGIVDLADRTMATCQFVAGWADPSCCLVTPPEAWGWVVRPAGADPGAVRIQSPTQLFTGSSFGGGELVVDGYGTSPWDLSLVLVTAPADFVVPEPLLADGAEVDRNRYLGFQPPASWAGRDIAIRVTLESLNGFPGSNGEVRWAGAPLTYVDDASSGTTFPAAQLQCAPMFTSWNMSEPSFLTGVEVVPGSTYVLQAVDSTCQGDLANEACYAPGLTVQTGKWGDVVSPFGGASQPNFADISAVVDKFKGLASAPSKTRSQLQPNLPDPSVSVNFADISVVVDAFKGFPYPYAGPQSCP